MSSKLIPLTPDQERELRRYVGAGPRRPAQRPSANLIRRNLLMHVTGPVGGERGGWYRITELGSAAIRQRDALLAVCAVLPRVLALEDALRAATGRERELRERPEWGERDPLAPSEPFAEVVDWQRHRLASVLEQALGSDRG